MVVGELILRRFRGIVEGEIKLSKLTVLVGPNNAGKTSILEALLLAHGVHLRVLGRLTVAAILSHIHQTLESRGLVHLLHQYTSRAVVWYSVARGDWALVIDRLGDALVLYYVASRDISIEWLLKAHTSAIEAKAHTIVKTSVTNGSWTVLGGHGSTCVGGRDEGVVVSALLVRPDLEHFVFNQLYQNWLDITTKGATRRAALWVSGIAGEQYADILAEPFLGGKPTLYAYRARDGARIRLGDLGDGVTLLMAARLAVEYADPQLLLWDDVESHMNPRTLQLLALWLAELVDHGKQVVVTTHSLEAATTIADMCDDARIVRLTLRDGRLATEYYSAEDVDKLKSLGVDVRA